MKNKKEGLCKNVSVEMSIGEWIAVGVVLHDYLKEKYRITNTKSLKKLVNDQMKSNSNDSVQILGAVSAFLQIDRLVTKVVVANVINDAKSAVNKCEESKHEQK